MSGLCQQLRCMTPATDDGLPWKTSLARVCVSFFEHNTVARFLSDSWASKIPFAFEVTRLVARHGLTWEACSCS